MNNKKYNFKLLAFFLFFVLIGTSAVSAMEFPGRKKYPGVPFISLEDLHKGFAQQRVVIVDVRSKMEFDTIHIKNAKHIPLNSKDFISKIKALRAANPAKKIAFYCNGVTCYKSYEGTELSKEGGVRDVYVFDLGIPGWAEAYPSLTLLIDKPMNKSKLKWIPKSQFKELCLSWEAFKAAAEKTKKEGKKLYIVDFRDSVQKGDISEAEMKSLPPDKKSELDKFHSKNKEVLDELKKHAEVLSIPLDKFISEVVDNEKMKDGVILGFDQVGKQVRWLMYYLEESFYTQYYFLDKGISKIIGIQAYSKK